MTRKTFDLIALFILTLSIAMFMAMTVQADATLDKILKTFHYDSETDRYFTTTDSRFGVRSLEDASMVSQIEVSIDGEDFQTYKGKMEFKTEGLHVVRFRAADPVLNWTPIQIFRIYVDRTPPRTLPVWVGPQHTTDRDRFVSPKSRLVLNSRDNLSGVSRVEMTRDNGAATAVNDPLSFSKEGTYSIQFSAKDRVGNQESPKTYSFKVDATAPKTKAQVKGFSFTKENTLFVSSESEIELVAQDTLAGVSRIETQINSGPTSEYTGSLFPMGQKMDLKFRAIDYVGNTEDWQSLVVYQDTVPPRVLSEEKGNTLLMSGKLFAKPGLTIQFAAKDSESGLRSFEVATIPGQYKPATQNSFRFDQPGEYYLSLRAQDQVGNIEESNPYYIVIDPNAPKTQITASNTWVDTNGVYLTGLPNRIEFQSEDSQAGIHSIEYSYDGKSFSQYRGGIDLSEWKSPEATIYYRGIDRLGNIEATRSARVKIRTSGPKVDLFVEREDLPNVPLSAIKGKLLTSQPERVPAQESTPEVNLAPAPQKPESKPEIKLKETSSKKKKSTSSSKKKGKKK